MYSKDPWDRALKKEKMDPSLAENIREKAGCGDEPHKEGRYYPDREKFNNNGSCYSDPECKVPIKSLETSGSHAIDISKKQTIVHDVSMNDEQKRLTLIRKKELMNKYFNKTDATTKLQKDLNEEERRKIVNINIILKLSESHFSIDAYNLILEQTKEMKLEVVEMMFNESSLN